MIAAGAVGAVSAAVLVAGLALSGSAPEGDSRGKQNGVGTSPTAGPSPDPTGAPDAPAATAAPLADTPGTAPSPIRSTRDTGNGTTPSSTPSTTSAAPSPPTTTPTTAEPVGVGRSDHPGRGSGKTKGPR
ncbi:hypothetical protein ACFZBP_27220 [Streptomyces sp. NPDC008086]|uniref:hypothetical protein n=1 Tax=Streptomyces sp. NPDC008086 TaxID=3364807 RepID=UPI0036E25E83